MPNTTPARRRVAIIGSGFSGLCLAIQLKRHGIDSFTIFEKSGRIGGTWRDNTYPGACCDVPAFAYCFSFEQKTDWTRKWAPQPEILDYMEDCARKHDLIRHIRFDTEIADARWDDEESLWRLTTTAGETIVAEVLVSGVGQLNRPFTPSLPGLDEFKGVRFHSARWPHDLDLTGKTVAVIGNAASAIQFVPQIAPRVAKLYIFQRSANWMIPRGDRDYTADERRRFARYPRLARLYRWWIWAHHEMNWPVFVRNRFFARKMAEVAERSMREIVHDPELQKSLVPDYPIGGKRILISDDYYQTLNRDNVDLVTGAIDHFTADTVVTRDGRTITAEVVILATGFESTAFLAPMAIHGRADCSLNDEWRNGARAYLGLSVAGFPNFFMMYGPNTNLGHNSIIFMIECQTNYILDCLRQMDTRRLDAIDLRRPVMEAFDARVQQELQRTVWTETGKSWYKNEAGRITNNWSGSTIRYWRSTRRADLSLYDCRVRERAAIPVRQPEARPAELSQPALALSRAEPIPEPKAPAA